MKLKRAKFNNVRLLQDVELKFSTDTQKKLTVIRAENGTGKTTALNGLIWGLYGSKMVPEKLYPLNLYEEGQTTFDISVEIDFDTEDSVTKAGRTAVTERSYRLIRKCTEKVSAGGAEFTRTSDDVSLYEYTPEGYKPKLLSEIEIIVNRSLPPHLKDIYFTDGDKALTFIESSATRNEKRSRVRKAIESLLSMKELEAVIKTLKGVKLSYAQKIDKSDYSKKLIDAETNLSDCEDWLSSSDEEISELELDKTRCEDALLSLKKQIEEQLKLGNKETLSLELKKTRKQIDRDRELKTASVKSLCSLLNSKDLSSALLYGSLGAGVKLLKEMKARDNFPKQFIPVLNDVLARERCLCGSDLSGSTDIGRSNRLKMTNVIEECKDVDLLNSRASSLYFSNDKYEPVANGWNFKYDGYVEQYFNADTNLRENESEIKQKEAVVDAIKDDSLITFRTNERIINTKKNDISSDLAILNDEKNRINQRLPGIKKEIEVFSNRVKKKNTSGGKHNLTSTILKVFESVFDRIKTTELKKVSGEMNDIFMSMIASGDEVGGEGVIKSCELTEEFDIRVYGPSGQPLNPDTELNGASRRAISLAFILALTKVSNVTAANVIDTPLGMTSGLVKASILKNLVEQGSQIIMFLTYDEIKGVENLLDEYAGSMMTLSFSGHYPRMLKNKPEGVGKTMVCSCSHRECCNVCERLDQTNLVMRAV